jgi:adenylate cyclase class 2
MREIEIKARVDNLPELEKQIIKSGIKLGKKLKQHDVVYALPGSEDNHLKAVWLRVRTENDAKVYFTLKRSVVGHLDSIEHEVVVDNAVELESIIKEMGYGPYSDLTKIRRKAKVGDIEICVDEVPGLGEFIEAEIMMNHDSDHDTAVDELWGLFRELGLSKKDEVHKGYDVLERESRGL